jgi:hypothetical protein
MEGPGWGDLGYTAKLTCRHTTAGRARFQKPRDEHGRSTCFVRCQTEPALGVSLATRSGMTRWCNECLGTGHSLSEQFFRLSLESCLGEDGSGCPARPWAGPALATPPTLTRTLLPPAHSPRTHRLHPSHIATPAPAHSLCPDDDRWWHSRPVQRSRGRPRLPHCPTCVGWRRPGPGRLLQPHGHRPTGAARDTPTAPERSRIFRGRSLKFHPSGADGRVTCGSSAFKFTGSHGPGQSRPGTDRWEGV